MPIWQCLIRGENFFPEEQLQQRMGFYTTRWVQALDSGKAELKVVEMLRAESTLQRPDWHDGCEPKSKIFVEEISICEGQPQRNQGFVWFAEED